MTKADGVIVFSIFQGLVQTDLNKSALFKAPQKKSNYSTPNYLQDEKLNLMLVYHHYWLLGKKMLLCAT
jgi:hypothetical protein